MTRLRPPSRLLPAFRSRPSTEELQAIDLLARLAEQRGSALYLVGGSVRDLLLGLHHLDFDFVAETDAPALAREFRAATAAKVTIHDWSRTVAVEGTGFRFDLVTARRESYPRPGALPVVTPSTLADDLARRDFSINAMALALSGSAAGSLIDPHDGLADLRERRLRVFHDASFHDDATRLWRAGRYAARLHLSIDPHTAALIRHGLRFLDTVSPVRILHELDRTLDETRPERALLLLDALGVLRATHAGLSCTRQAAAAFPRVRRLGPAHLHAAYLCAMLAPVSARSIAGVIARLEPERHTREALAAFPELAETLAGLARQRAGPGIAAPALGRLPEAALAGWAARYPRTRGGRMARAYLTEWRHTHPLLDGNDLIRLGVPAGPAIGDALRTLRAARLDGRVATLDDEIRLVQTECIKRTEHEEA
jgi:tRNA nucleotidyltransferase (CCA-adding enzyme)